MNGFENVKVDQFFSFNPIKNHLNLRTEPVWNRYIEPKLIK